MAISLICAVDERGAIGYKNKLLYHIKEDLQRFKQLTTENHHDDKNYILMGKNTFESLPNVLENRINVVVTRNEKYKPKYTSNEVMVVHNLERTLNHYHETGEQTKELFIIGGAEIYTQSFPYADKIYLTIIHDDSRKADAFFPMEELVNFKVVKVERKFSEKYGIEFSFVDLVRKEGIDEQ